MTTVNLPFRDRRHAGRVLASYLEQYRGRPGLLVLALPRGGVAVGFEVARELHAPLDIFVVRKLGVPGHEEYAMGAIASGGVKVMNPMPGLTIRPEAIAAVVEREQAELVRRELLYRQQRPAIPLHGRTVIVVDDGLATGSTMHAAVLAIRQQQPLHITVAGSRPHQTGKSRHSASGCARGWPVAGRTCSIAPELTVSCCPCATTLRWWRYKRLQRAIGVIYRPDTERQSHYFYTHLTQQFDAVIYIDEISALEPLDRGPVWIDREAPETFPSGINH